MGRKPSSPDSSTYAGRVAARLRELREKKGLTVEHMVNSLNTLHGANIKPVTYYTYEAGSRDLPLNLFPAVASVLGTSIAKFLPPE